MDKINLNVQSDLLKFSFSELKNTKLYNFQGEFYKKLFDEALQLERDEKAQVSIKEVEFEICHHVFFGQRVAVCGSSSELGKWNPTQSLKLLWNEGDIWTGRLPYLSNFDYKYVVVEKESSVTWEDGENRVFNLEAFSDILKKAKSRKKIELDPYTSISYDYTSKKLTLTCKWK